MVVEKKKKGKGEGCRWLVLGFVLGLAGAALAADPVVCTVATSTSTAATTALPSSGAGACNWGKGAVILMQCTTDVYVDTTNLVDVPAPLDGGVVGSAVATSADQRVDFSSNTDPYPIYLGNNDQHVSLLAVSSAGSCKFMKTQRKRPY